MKLSMRRRISVVVFMVGAVVGSPGQCGSYPQPMSQEQVLSVLRDSTKTAPQERDGACITFAIGQLENKYSDEATVLLVDHLDFARPLEDAEKAGFVTHGAPTIGNRYPATAVLMSFGQQAVPAVLAAIANNSSTLVQQNATYTLVQIFRDQPEKAIDLLKAKSMEAGSPMQSERLRTAAREALRWCGRSHLEACRLAENRPEANASQ